MSEIANTEQETTMESVTQSLADLDALRVTELTNLNVIKQSKVGLETRNFERLTAKYGDDHPLVVQSSQKIEFGDFFAGEINLEVIRAQTPPPVTDGKSWLVHGYVFNEERNPVSGLTVLFFDENDNPLHQSEQAQTGRNGYFVLEAANIEDFPQNVRVGVSKDDLSELVFTPKIGVINYAEIFVAGGLEEPVPGVSDWSVTGKIIDADGNGIKDLIVNVYDKDPIDKDTAGDDFLGKAKTNAKGAYTVNFTKKEFSDLGENFPEIYLVIEDQEGKQIWAGRDEAYARSGHIGLADVQIGDVDNVTQS